VRARLSVVFPR